MRNEMDMFFEKMLNKINILENEFSKFDYLKEICDFFGFSHAFVYEADYKGNFYQTEYYQIRNVLPFNEIYDLKTSLGMESLSEISSKKYIISAGDDEKLEIEKKLTGLFNSNILIFIPILNQHLELAGFVGLSDRRKKIRGKEFDIHNACMVLTLLANTVKLELFKKGIDNAEKVLNNVLDHVGIDIYVNDFYTHDVLYVNKSMAAPYGGVENMLGKKCWGSIFTDKSGACDFCPQQKLLDENGYPSNTYTWDYQRMIDGSWFRVLSSSIPWTDGRVAHIVASLDITQSKQNQLLIEKLAQYDHLTGLPNRRSLQDDVDSFIANSDTFGSEWYVFFCDLDGFKKINDTIGHNGGDVLLKSISKRLNNLQSDSLRTYRQGGDEFVVIIKDPKCASTVKHILDTLLNIFCDTYEFEDYKMKCGCSIGVAHYPLNALTHKKLFHVADMAMYAAKNAGGGAVRFYKEKSYITTEDYFSAE